jgi:hypothetical protein
MYLTQGLHRSLQRHPAKTALTHLDADGQRRSWPATSARVPDTAGRVVASAQGCFRYLPLPVIPPRN